MRYIGRCRESALLFPANSPQQFRRDRDPLRCAVAPLPENVAEVVGAETRYEDLAQLVRIGCGLEQLREVVGAPRADLVRLDFRVELRVVLRERRATSSAT
jgi:hypothetical protein